MIKVYYDQQYEFWIKKPLQWYLNNIDSLAINYNLPLTKNNIWKYYAVLEQQINQWRIQVKRGIVDPENIVFITNESKDNEKEYRVDKNGRFLEYPEEIYQITNKQLQELM